VTIDALGCQGESARQSIDQGGAYGLRVQENQPTLYADCVALLAWRTGPHPLAEESVLGTEEQVDGGHGRVASRHGGCTTALEDGVSGERWPGLTSLVMVASPRPRGGQDEGEQRYERSALPRATDAEAQRLQRVIRTHWEMANRVHGVLEVAMAEDTNRTRKGARAPNRALIRKLALHLWRRETSVKTGFAAKQKRAGWDRNDLLNILAQA